MQHFSSSSLLTDFCPWTPCDCDLGWSCLTSSHRECSPPALWPRSSSLTLPSIRKHKGSTLQVKGQLTKPDSIIWERNNQPHYQFLSENHILVNKDLCYISSPIKRWKWQHSRVAFCYIPSSPLHLWEQDSPAFNKICVQEVPELNQRYSLSQLPCEQFLPFHWFH